MKLIQTTLEKRLIHDIEKRDVKSFKKLFKLWQTIANKTENYNSYIELYNFAYYNNIALNN